MTQPTYRRIVLAARPEGEPTPDHFRLETAPLPEPGPGQVLIRILWLSLDPYMRGRMSAAKSYAKPVEVGEVMEGGTVGEVVISNHPGYAPGDFLLSHSGWQEYAIADGTTVRKQRRFVIPVLQGGQGDAHVGCAPGVGRIIDIAALLSECEGEASVEQVGHRCSPSGRNVSRLRPMSGFHDVKTRAKATMELTFVAVFSHQSAMRLKRLILPTRRLRRLKIKHIDRSGSPPISR